MMSTLRRIIKAVTTPRNKCGVDGFSCGKCAACVRKEEQRWNSIWKQKYGQQEAEYYSRASLDPRLSSAGQSSLNNNWPVDEGDYSLISSKYAADRKRKAAGVSKKKASRRAGSRVSPPSA